MTVTNERIRPMNWDALSNENVKLCFPIGGGQYFLREFQADGEKHWQIWCIAGGVLSEFKEKLAGGEIDLLEPFGDMRQYGTGETPALLINAVIDPKIQVKGRG